MQEGCSEKNNCCSELWITWRSMLPSKMGYMLWILMVIWYIHNTNTKCRKTKRIPHMCGTGFGHIGETRMENSIMMDFEVILILNHLTLATFLRKVKWLKYRSQAIGTNNKLISDHTFVVCSPISVVSGGFIYLQKWLK